MEFFDQNVWARALREARGRLGHRLAPTPLVKAHSMQTPQGGDIYLKLENRQVSGSFKFRAALNGLLASREYAAEHGVVASSSGNFSTAVATAAAWLGIEATIVMVPSASPYKVERTKKLGAKVLFCDDDYSARQEMVDTLVEETGALELHPHSSLETIAGNASCGDEILRQLPDVGSVVVPTSGGGLVAGICLALDAAPHIVRVVPAQPEGNPTFVRSLTEGEAWKNPEVKTAMDGIQADYPGPLGFEVATAFGVLGGTVSDENSFEVVRRLAEDENLVVEPSGAVGLAAVLAGTLDELPPPVVVILTGGNVEPKRLARLMTGESD